MKTKEEIKRLLKKDKHLRDSDPKLISTYWFYEVKAKGLNIYEMKAYDFLKLFADSKLTNTETISRMRRQVQEENEDLRGSYYKGRQTTKQKEWKQRLGYEVN